MSPYLQRHVYTSNMTVHNQHQRIGSQLLNEYMIHVYLKNAIIRNLYSNCSISIYFMASPTKQWANGLYQKTIHIPRFHVPCFWGYLKRRRCFHSIRASMQEKHALISQLEEFDVGKAECRMQEDKDGGTKS